MKVKEIMTTDVVKIAPNTYLEEAARLMKIHDVGLLPVLEGDRVLGVITDRDIVVRGLAQGWNCLLAEARVIMNQDVVWCFEDTPVETVAHLMADRQVHRLLVFGRDLYLKGVVSLDDVALALRDESEIGQTLREVVIPAVAFRAAA